MAKPRRKRRRLQALRKKLRRRVKSGQANQPAVLRQRMKRLKVRIDRLTKRIKRAASTAPGPPSWGGCRRLTNRVIRIVNGRAPVTSRKRSWAPGSDHWFGSLLSDAVDLGTFNGAALAHEIARALGISNYSTGNFNSYLIKVGKHTYRVQILWAVENHFNHVHVGFRRV